MSSSTGGGRRRCNTTRSSTVGSSRRSRGSGRQRCKSEKVSSEALATNDHSIGARSLGKTNNEAAKMANVSTATLTRREHWELVNEFLGNLGMTLRSGMECTSSVSRSIHERTDDTNDSSYHDSYCEQRHCGILPSCQEREAIISDEEEQCHVDDDDLSVRDHARLLLNFMSSSPSPNALLCDEDIEQSGAADAFPTSQPYHTADTEVMSYSDDEQRRSLSLGSSEPVATASCYSERIPFQMDVREHEEEEGEEQKDLSEDGMTEEEDSSEQARFTFTCPSLSLEAECELGPYGGNLSVTKVATPSPPPSEDEETRHSQASCQGFKTPTNRYPGVRESGAVPKPAHLFRRPIGSLDRDDIAVTSRSMVQNFLRSFETAMEWRAKSWIHSLSKIVLFKREYLIDAWNSAGANEDKPLNDLAIEQEIMRSKEAFVMEALAVAMTHMGVLEVTSRFSLREPLVKEDAAFASLGCSEAQDTGKRGLKKTKRAPADSCTVMPSPRKKRAGMSTRSQVSKNSSSLSDMRPDEDDRPVREATRIDFSPIVPASFTVEYALDFEAIVTVSTGPGFEADDDQHTQGQVVPFTVTLQAPGIVRGFFLNEEGQLGAEVLSGVEVDVDTEVLAMAVEQQTRMVVRKAAEVYLASCAEHGRSDASRSEQGLVTSPDAETHAQEVMQSPVLESCAPYTHESSSSRAEHQTVGSSTQAVIVTPRYRTTPKEFLASPGVGDVIKPVPEFPLESEEQQVIGTATQRRHFPHPRRLSSAQRNEQFEQRYHQEDYYNDQDPYSNSSRPLITDPCKPPSPRSTTTATTTATTTTAPPFVSPLPSNEGRSEVSSPGAVRGERPYFRDLDDDIKSSKRRLPAPRNGGGTSLPALVQVCAAALCTD